MRIDKESFKPILDLHRSVFHMTQQGGCKTFDGSLSPAALSRSLAGL